MKKKGLNKHEGSPIGMDRQQRRSLYGLVGFLGGLLLFATYLSSEPLIILLGALTCGAVGYKLATQ